MLPSVPMIGFPEIVWGNVHGQIGERGDATSAAVAWWQMEAGTLDHL
jgi:hypothetical protein